MEALEGEANMVHLLILNSEEVEVEAAVAAAAVAMVLVHKVFNQVSIQVMSFLGIMGHPLDRIFFCC
jgi:hypothetical protein